MKRYKVSAFYKDDKFKNFIPKPIENKNLDEKDVRALMFGNKGMKFHAFVVCETDDGPDIPTFVSKYFFEPASEMKTDFNFSLRQAFELAEMLNMNTKTLEKLELVAKTLDKVQNQFYETDRASERKLSGELYDRRCLIEDLKEDLGGTNDIAEGVVEALKGPKYKQFTEGAMVETTVFMSEDDTGDRYIDVGTVGKVWAEVDDSEQLVGVEFEGLGLHYLPQDVLMITEKKKYRVWAEVTSMCYVDLWAEDETMAKERAELLDGGDFITDEGAGGFDIQKSMTHEVE